MTALEAIGAISKVTMREFDAACLQPVQELAPEAIRTLREREHLSQAVFATYLNISKNLVSDWERGKGFCKVRKSNQKATTLFGSQWSHFNQGRSVAADL
ncbi:MAG: helix-turn-helix domain-containing protein [Caldilinea sp.]